MAITPVPAMTDTPPFPALADRAAGTYNAKAYAFGSHMSDTFNSELVAVATNVQGNAADAAASATTATTKASEATSSASNAASSAASALTAPGTSATSATSLLIGTGSKSLIIQTSKAYSVGQSVVIADSASPSANWMWGQITSYDAGTGALVVNVKEAGGSGTYGSWAVSLSSSPGLAAPRIVRSPRASNTMLGASDQATLIDITGGTFSQTFAAAAVLGNGWCCWLRNSGTGDITLDPNGAELIDGLSSYIMYPGEARLIQCNGTTLTSMVISPFNKTFTVSSNFIKPPGYTDFGGVTWNGGRGGSGGSGYNTTNGFPGSGGSGGTGGEGGWFTIGASKLGASSTVTIGAGGSGGTATNIANAAGGAEGAGGTTSFGPISLAIDDYGPWFARKNGGNGSSIGSPPTAGVAARGGGGGGGGGAGGNQGNTVGAGGTSITGGNGGSGGAQNTTGVAGAARGGGGGGGGGASADGTMSGPGGPGGRGEVCVWGIA
ncbi:hypothetical protein HHL21_14545 [Massilia sp. RP-1-19]|uniref:Uncharacterized protein n=1 Tax=Massilia polaris TaxID=2728846 RepID=A0A848HSL6_9BURK|nr:hypothetical protein [Massilia polaris]NML62273.1 hypothetical protein [Massilia polaris]